MEAEGGEKDKMAAKTPLTILFTQFSTSWATATAWRVLATGAMASSYRRGLPGQFIPYVNGNGVICFKCLSLAVASASIFMLGGGGVLSSQQEEPSSKK